MIIEYEEKYQEEVKDLLEELQEYIQSIDKEKYNILTPEYRDKYFIEKQKEIEEHQGKMYLYLEDNKVLGLVIGIIEEAQDRYDFKTPIRGRITELIVTKKTRHHGIGKLLIKEIEKYLISKGAKSILLVVFAYNDIARSFYDKNNYHERVLDLIKTVD